MKMAILPIVLILCVLLMPVRIMAYNTQDIRFTVHNLSNNNIKSTGLMQGDRNYAASNASGLSEICIFCHTPHNASPAVPLWNKVITESASSYRLYTSSATLSPTARAAVLSANSESLLCLTCHDGKSAVNVLHNSRNRSATVPVTGDAIVDVGFGSSLTPMSQFAVFPGSTYTPDLGATRAPDGTIIDANYGYNLTDDHPIGFSYKDAQAQKPNDLHLIEDAKFNKARFFGPNRDRMECSSCHDPHMFYGQTLSGTVRVLLSDIPGYGTVTQDQLDKTPFLVRDNIGSALCLACHIK